MDSPAFRSAARWAGAVRQQPAVGVTRYGAFDAAFTTRAPRTPDHLTLRGRRHADDAVRQGPGREASYNIELPMGGWARTGITRSGPARRGPVYQPRLERPGDPASWPRTPRLTATTPRDRRRILRARFRRATGVREANSRRRSGSGGERDYSSVLTTYTRRSGPVPAPCRR